ncbi:MAG: serine acetyltransferase [Phycisphaerae bacterium]|nr:serine acetyltransferase [Phycisphaerae bacterium]
MIEHFALGDKLAGLVGRLVDSYRADDRTHHINRIFVPNRREIIEIVELLLELAYPGYYGRQNLTTHNVGYHVGELLPKLAEKLHRQIDQCLCHERETRGNGDAAPSNGAKNPNQCTLAFLEEIPRIREQLAGDVQAAYDGDPAAVHTDEVILAYPGVLAVTVYRFAHALHAMGVPLMPRIMTEWAHTHTGVDIHPGATIGRNFFIDHATGVVIGETAEIGDNVKLYQGVTLGAMSFPKDERGQLIRGHKRHPTVEENVTIYANATILGGNTRVGRNGIINGSVFLTGSVPPDCTVSLSAPALTVRKRRPRKNRESEAVVDGPQE